MALRAVLAMRPISAPNTRFLGSQNPSPMITGPKGSPRTKYARVLSSLGCLLTSPPAPARIRIRGVRLLVKLKPRLVRGFLLLEGEKKTVPLMAGGAEVCIRDFSRSRRYRALPRPFQHRIVGSSHWYLQPGAQSLSGSKEKFIFSNVHGVPVGCGFFALAGAADCGICLRLGSLVIIQGARNEDVCSCVGFGHGVVDTRGLFRRKRKSASGRDNSRLIRRAATAALCRRDVERSGPKGIHDQSDPKPPLRSPATGSTVCVADKNKRSGSQWMESIPWSRATHSICQSGNFAEAKRFHKLRMPGLMLSAVREQKYILKSLRLKR